MTRLAWHAPGSRRFEAGANRGVLYPHEGPGVPWNGLRSVNEIPQGVSVEPQYYDGIRFNQRRAGSEFSAELRCITYPKEFEPYDGMGSLTQGIKVHDQDVRHRFGMSYCTRIGDENRSTDLGFRIHLLYNLTALPDPRQYTTLGSESSPTEFGWLLSGIPVKISGFKPSCHISVDSTELHPDLVRVLQDILYGSESADPRLPTPDELSVLVDNWELITITDNGDGTWTATGPDELITMLDATTFRIEGASAVYLNTTTYTITSA